MSINNVDTYSEQYRLECEARHMLTLPLDQRRNELEEIKKFRGEKATEYLKKEIIIQFNIKKELQCLQK
jgi:hypothetical protein